MGSRLLFAIALLALLAIAYLSAEASGLGRIAGIVVVVAGAASLIASSTLPRSRSEQAESRPAIQPAMQPAPVAAQAAAPAAALALVDVLDALPVGVMVIGEDGKIRSFNAAAGELFGVPAERAANRALIEIVRNFELDKRVAATLRDLTDAHDAGAAILAHARDIGADYLVMGAYGHWRLGELIFGGTTRTVLTGMQKPVFMAH